MRTNLSQIKQDLFYNVINVQFKHLLGTTVNHKSFMLAFFPLSFLTTEENKGMIVTQSNNASRLSNIFSRATHKHRLEPQFRTRFLNAFDGDFFQEMVDNAAHYMKGSNKDALARMVSRIIQEDEALNASENRFIRDFMTTYVKDDSPAVVTMMILWAFHIGDFDSIIQVLKDYKPSASDETPLNLKRIEGLLNKRHISEQHLYEYLEIVLAYSASSPMSAIAMQSHLEHSEDVNPLIYSELADMHFYGINYFRADRKKALRYYSEAANEHFASAIFSEAILTYLERYQLQYNRIPQIMKKFQKALDYGSLMPLNNIGIIYHRALIHHAKTVMAYAYASDVFGGEARKDVLEMYKYLSEEPFFQEMTNLLPTVDKGFEGELLQLNALTEAEDLLIKRYLLPSFESGYFYAKGSELMIYEERYQRYKKLYDDYQQVFDTREINRQLRDLILKATEDFATYPCSESYYKYGLLLENKGPAYHQSAYEYYYKAVFEVPMNSYFHHAIWHLLRLHFGESVPYVREELKVKPLILKLIRDYSGNAHSQDTILLDCLSIYLKYFKNDPLLLSSKQQSQLKTNIKIEMSNKQAIRSAYDTLLMKLENERAAF